MSEKRVIALFAALAAGLGTMGAGLVAAAQTPGMEWALPVGTTLIICGTTIGATLGAYKGASWDRNPAPGSESYGYAGTPADTEIGGRS